jgi:hypothetical protein
VGFFRAILIPPGTLCVFFPSHRLERRRASRQGLAARAVRNPS